LTAALGVLDQAEAALSTAETVGLSTLEKIRETHKMDYGAQAAALAAQRKLIEATLTQFEADEDMVLATAAKDDYESAKETFLKSKMELIDNLSALNNVIAVSSSQN
jgi:hypothetical protein